MPTMRSNLKPPLPKSPIRLRSRQVLQSNSPSLQTPPGSLTKSQKPARIWDADMEPELRPEYHSISCELSALARMVKDELRKEDKAKMAASNLCSVIADPTPVFERGSLYDAYSARRNERLKRKTGEAAVEEVKATPYNLGVTVQPTATKRRGTAKKQLESLKKSVSATYTETPRYMLRSRTKENKKPPLPTIERSVAESAMKSVTTRRRRRI